MTTSTNIDLKNTAKTKPDCTEEKTPKIIKKSGCNKPATTSIEYYEQTTHEIYEAKQINEGLFDLANGKTVDGDVVKQRLAAKYGI